MDMGLLFSQGDFFSLSTGHLEKAKATARAIPEARLKVASDDELVEELVASYSLMPPSVKWEDAAVSRTETQVDLMYVPNTMAYFDRRSFMAPGEKVTVTVPFQGESDYFKVRPTSYTFNPPRARVNRDTLAFDYSGVQVDIDRSKREYEQTKNEIVQCMTTLSNDCQGYNLQIAPAVRPIIQEKRNRMEKGEASLSGFGLPIK
jgi:hypothetical protein